MSNSKIIKLFFAIFLVFLLRGVKGDAVRARFAGGAYSCALESSLSLDLTQTAKRECRAEKKKKTNEALDASFACYPYGTLSLRLEQVLRMFRARA